MPNLFYNIISYNFYMHMNKHVCVTQQTQGGAVSRGLVAFSHRAAEEEESGQGRTGK